MAAVALKKVSLKTVVARAPVTMVSRVGNDRLGEEVLRRAARYGVGTDLLQVDPELPTGFVRVTVDTAGNPEYEILEPSAWDAIAPTETLLGRAADARAIVFGTLAGTGSHDASFADEEALAGTRIGHFRPAVGNAHRVVPEQDKDTSLVDDFVADSHEDRRYYRSCMDIGGRGSRPDPLI